MVGDNWPAPGASAFSVCTSVLQSSEMERLDGEARWLGQEVGSLRDLDVAAKEMVRREVEVHPDEPGLATLADFVFGKRGNSASSCASFLAESRALE